MLAVNESAKPSLTSIVAIDAVLSESSPQVQVPPQWSQRFMGFLYSKVRKATWVCPENR